VRFAVPAIWCPTRITFYLFFAPNRRCNLVYASVSVLQLPKIVHTPNRMHQIATRYRMLRVNGSNSVCDTKSQIHQIASAICSKSHALNRSCNQPFKAPVCQPWSIWNGNKCKLSFIFPVNTTRFYNLFTTIRAVSMSDYMCGLQSKL
jgi:hypothetical protein